ncbi:MAG: DUF1176 domain-containing protein [Pseudomonadota bacterium]
MPSLFFLALLAAAQAQPASAGPQPGPNQGYDNWHIACDNIASCEANALASDFRLDQPATLLIQRQAGQVGYFRVVVRLRDPDVARVGLLVDGRKLAEGEVDSDGRFIIAPSRALKAARAIAGGRQATVVNATPGVAPIILARISLKGSAAALRRMDAEQGRTGTSDAIVARGRRSYRGKAEILPVVTQIAPARFEKLPGRKAIRELAATSGCDEQRRNDDESFDDRAQPLSQSDEEQVALVMIECGIGAYNVSALPYIARRDRSDDDAEWRFAPARFDYRPAWSANPDRPLLVNPYYNEQEGILGSYAKGRGLGDCGSGQSYVWDGDMFRLFEASAMDECRGVWQWPTVWRAYVQRRSADG